MARDGSGTYNLPNAAVETATPISSNGYNTTLTDIATALSESLASDGQTEPTANLPMATFLHTNVGNATARNQYAALGQVQDAAAIWGGTAGGTANAITISLAPAITAYAAGLTVRFIVASANTGNVTLSINSLTATAFRRWDGTEWPRGALQAGQMITATYNGSVFQCAPGGLVIDQIGPIVTAAGAANVDFILPSNYTHFRLVGTRITPSVNAVIVAQMSSNNGSSYDAGGSDYNFSVSYANTTTVTAGGGSASSISLTTTALGNDPRIGFELAIDPGAASRAFNLRWEAGFLNSASEIVRLSGFGTRNTNVLATNIRIAPAGGTITGAFYLLGYR